MTHRFFGGSKKNEPTKGGQSCRVEKTPPQFSRNQNLQRCCRHEAERLVGASNRGVVVLSAFGLSRNCPRSRLPVQLRLERLRVQGAHPTRAEIAGVLDLTAPWREFDRHGESKCRRGGAPPPRVRAEAQMLPVLSTFGPNAFGLTDLLSTGVSSDTLWAGENVSFARRHLDNRRRRDCQQFRQLGR